MNEEPDRAVGVPVQFEEVISATKRAEVAGGQGLAGVLQGSRREAGSEQVVGYGDASSSMGRLSCRNGTPERSNQTFKCSQFQTVGPDPDPSGRHAASEVPSEGTRDDAPFRGEHAADRDSLRYMRICHAGDEFND